MPAIKYIPNYTIQDYNQWEGDWELWDGEPVSMSPSPFGRHQWAATRIAGSINQQLDDLGCDDCFAVLETDWVVGERTVVRPDISVCCGRFPERFIESPPTLVVEVLSESTADKDRNSKRSLYEAQCVNCYVILDLATQRFDVFELVNGKYVERDGNEPVAVRLHADCIVRLIVPRRKLEEDA